MTIELGFSIRTAIEGAFSNCIRCIVALMLVHVASACGATNYAKDDRVYVSGSITDADVSGFVALLDQNPKSRTVVFDQCLGGTVSAAYRYARVIRERQLTTVARHQCSSACAVAFLGGTSRHFDSAVWLTAIGLHVSRRADGSGPSSEVLNQQVVSFIVEMTEGKLGERVLELIGKSWSEGSGVFFVSFNLLGYSTDRVVYCDGTQGKDIGKCPRLTGIDAYSQGIVTKP